MGAVTKLRALVGRDEDGSVLVAGCIEQSLWEVVSSQDSDKWFDQMKEIHTDYVTMWREFIITVPTDELKAVFATTEINAHITEH